MTKAGVKHYEKNLTKAAIKYLKKIDCSFVNKRHAGAFRMGKADLTGAIEGLRFEFELKVGDNKPTDLQKKWLQKCKDAKCLCACIWDMDELKWIIENYKKTGIDLPLDNNWRLIRKYRTGNQENLT